MNFGRSGFPNRLWREVPLEPKRCPSHHLAVGGSESGMVQRGGAECSLCIRNGDCGSDSVVGGAGRIIGEMLGSDGQPHLEHLHPDD